MVKKALKNTWYVIKMVPLFIVGGIAWVVQKGIETALGRKY